MSIKSGSSIKGTLKQIIDRQQAIRPLIFNFWRAGGIGEDVPGRRLLNKKVPNELNQIFLLLKEQEKLCNEWPDVFLRDDKPTFLYLAPFLKDFEIHATSLRSLRKNVLDIPAGKVTHSQNFTELEGELKGVVLKRISDAYSALGDDGSNDLSALLSTAIKAIKDYSWDEHGNALRLFEKAIRGEIISQEVRGLRIFVEEVLAFRDLFELEVFTPLKELNNATLESGAKDISIIKKCYDSIENTCPLIKKVMHNHNVIEEGYFNNLDKELDNIRAFFIAWIPHVKKGNLQQHFEAAWDEIEKTFLLEKWKSGVGAS